MIKNVAHRVVNKFPALIPVRDFYWKYKHLFFWKLGHYQSLLNREETIFNYLKTHKVRKLQVGCWPYMRKGWLNTELYGSKDLVPIDLLKPMPVPKSSIDYIFSEHVHEHFTLEQGNFMLREYFKVLRKNGRVRIATPNLQFLIDLYSPKKTTLQKKYIKWSTDEFKLPGGYQDTMVINNFVRAWGHEFIYDFKSLKWALENVGFVDVKEYKPGESDDIHLRNMESHWKSTTQEFNNLETLVVEARKPSR